MRATLALTLVVGASASQGAVVSATGATKSALLEFDPQSFEEQVVQRGTGKAPFIITFTMGPSSPCGPCHQLAPVLEAAATTLRSHVRVGIVNCDVHKNLCQSQMGGRGWFPVIKVYAAPGVERFLDLETFTPELPSGSVIKLVTNLLDALTSIAPNPTEFWADPQRQAGRSWYASEGRRIEQAVA